MASSEQAQVNTPCSAYNAMEERRALPRTLMGGTQAMRSAGEKFMPKHPAEKSNVYVTRLNSTVLYNGFDRAVKSQVGKVFMKPISLTQETPEAIKALQGNIDGEGRNLNAFAMDVFADAMAEGLSFIFTDMPEVKRADGAAPSLADQKAQNARPFWRHVKAKDFIGWRSRANGGEQVLTEIRMKECITVTDGTWGDRDVERIRVVRPGEYEVWEERDSKAGKVWSRIEQGTTSIDFIAIAAVYTCRTGFMLADPPMMSLAELNQEHWVSSSEHRRALTFLRFAMLKLTGVDSDSKITIGADQVIRLPLGGDAAYVEHTGAGIGSGLADLEAIEKRMTTAGMTYRIESAGAVTATVGAIDSQETNAGLKAVAHGFRDSLNIALAHMAAFLKVPDKQAGVTVYDGFADSTPPGETTEVFKLRAIGELSLETFYNELKRRNVLDKDFDIEQEKERLRDEGKIFGEPEEKLAGDGDGGRDKGTGKKPTQEDS